MLNDMQRELVLRPPQPRSSTSILQSPSDKLLRYLRIAELNLEDSQGALREGESNEMDMLHKHLDEDVSSIEKELR